MKQKVAAWKQMFMECIEYINWRTKKSKILNVMLSK